MLKYTLKRIGYMIVVLIILSFLMFLLYNLVPNNRAHMDATAEKNANKQLLAGMTEDEQKVYFDELYLKYQRAYGTDTNNMVIRYLRWIGVYPLYNGQCNGLIQGNFGYSYEYRDNVINVIGEPMKNTIFINIFSVILALGITIPLGILCAVKRGKIIDKITQIITIIGYSLPTFLVAILFIWIFCSKLDIFPPSGMKTPGSDYAGMQKFLDSMYYMALPLIVMTFGSLGGMTRYVRASMIEALSMDCIKTARSKGLKEKVVVFSHAWKNALIPIVTLVVGWFLSIFSGSLMIENIFAINGMGKIMITALRTSDTDVIMLLQMFYVMLALFGNLLIDIIYGLVDPRVRVNK